MHIQILSTLKDLNALRPEWDAAWEVDAHASVFLSWPWISAWFERPRFRWVVLVARPEVGGPCVGILPLRIDARPLPLRPIHSTILRMGGSPAADYTGIICKAGWEQRVVPAFGDCIVRRLRWDRAEIEETTDPRVDLLIALMEVTNRVALVRRQASPCPQIELPDNWEQYLQERVSASTRKTLRRRIKALEQTPGYCITDATASDLDQHIKTLLSLWTARWPEFAAGCDKESIARILTRCFDARMLWLRTIWLGDVPIAAGAGFIDRPRCAYRGYMMGVSQQHKDLSPGIVLVCQAIQHSISQGLKLFDFLRGDEEYKFSFGAIARRNHNAHIVRQRWLTQARSAADRLRVQLAIGERISHAARALTARFGGKHRNFEPSAKSLSDANAANEFESKHAPPPQESAQPPSVISR